MDKTIALDALSALSHETRLDVFRLLVRSGPGGMVAGAIADRLNARQNTMSTNLNILARAGLIRARRDGRSIFYAADYAGMQALLAYLMQDCCCGAPEIIDPLLTHFNSAKKGPCS